MKNIVRYSDVPHAHSLIIDNFNRFTGSSVYVERVDFQSVYRVVKRQGLRVHEMFFIDEREANKYFSQLMAEKEELF